MAAAACTATATLALATEHEGDRSVAVEASSLTSLSQSSVPMQRHPLMSPRGTPPKDATRPQQQQQEQQAEAVSGADGLGPAAEGDLDVLVELSSFQIDNARLRQLNQTLKEETDDKVRSLLYILGGKKLPF